MEAGVYREQITLQRHDTDTDSWVLLDREPVIWAAPESVGDERYFFRVRWRADLFGFRDTIPALRVLFRNRTLDVEDVTETLELGEARISAKSLQIPVPDLSSSARQTWKRWP
jgi:hypothetical protein